VTFQRGAEILRIQEPSYYDAIASQQTRSVVLQPETSAQCISSQCGEVPFLRLRRLVDSSLAQPILYDSWPCPGVGIVSQCTTLLRTSARSLQRRAFLTLENSSRASTVTQLKFLLNLEREMTFMEARFQGMSSTALWLGFWERRILNRSIITDIRWSVCFTQWLGTTIHSLSILLLMKPSGPYGDLGQCETNNAGFHLASVQIPSHTMQYPPRPPGAYAAPNNQGTSPIWRLNNCWVSYAEEDEVHVTIALRKIPST
jgi:hypothetical protein